VPADLCEIQHPDELETAPAGHRTGKRRAQAFAAWAALIAVPTFIASLYGMNFRNMPELEWPLGYPLVLAVMAAFDLYFWYRFRKAGWL
jgi:magnesium transporter